MSSMWTFFCKNTLLFTGVQATVLSKDFGVGTSTANLFNFSSKPIKATPDTIETQKRPLLVFAAFSLYVTNICFVLNKNLRTRTALFFFHAL